jgi:hypothetical protein
MITHPVSDQLIKECAESLSREKSNDKFIGWETLVSILVYEGLRAMLPEIREWIKLGATTITLKRLELRKKLADFAKQKELEFPQAEKAAAAIADRIDFSRIASELKKTSD